jgi:hypothetical protein
MRRKQTPATKQNDIDRELDRLGKRSFSFASTLCWQLLSSELLIESIWKLF